jgi:hypothetical protein
MAVVLLEVGRLHHNYGVELHTAGRIRINDSDLSAIALPGARVV